MMAAADPSMLKSDYVLPPDYEIMTETAEVFTKALLLGMEPERNNFADDDVDVLPFEEAVAYMRKRLPVDGKTYYELADKMRYRAFTVSRLADGDAVRRVQSMLVKAMDEGSGLQQFLQLTEGQLADAAGMGKGVGWYYETVYRTNTATAYNVGRAIGFEETPPVALELIGIDDARQTEICHSLTVPPFRKPYGDPVWEHMWPPFHFNCRTTVRAIYDESEIEDAGGPDKFYTQGAPDYKPEKGFGTYPLDKNDKWWNLTDSMKNRAEEYGLADEFAKAKEKLIDADENLPDKANSFIIDEARSLDDLSDYARKEWGVESVNLTGLDANAVKGTFKEMEAVYNKYPELKGQIVEINQSKNGIMSTNMKEEGFILNFNPGYYSDIENIKELYARGVRLGYYPEGTTWTNAGAHELGHVAHGIFAKKNSNYVYAWQAKLDWSDNTTTKRIVADAWKNVKKEYPKGTRIADARLGISEYAKTNTSETVAEAFSDVFSNGANARPLSLEIVRLLREGLK